MYKKTITYEDFDGNKRTEDFYFNLTKMELAELEISQEGGMSALMQKLIDSQDKLAIFRTFDKIVGLAYGVRSEDGRRFTKSPEAWQEFKETNAYDSLLTEIMMTENGGNEFIENVVPQDLRESVATSASETVVQLPAQKDPTPWITENRDPTKKELLTMNKEQLQQAMKAKQSRKAWEANQADDETEALRRAFEED